MSRVFATNGRGLRRQRFSIATLLLAIAAGGGVLGVWTGIASVRLRAQREAIIEAQKRELESVGGSFTKAAHPSRRLIAVDLSTARVDDAWLLARIRHWEYRALTELRVDAGAISAKCRAEVGLQLPTVKIVVIGEGPGVRCRATKN